ncbi:MAG: D-alanine--D-alanine ligase [Nitrospiria bacterium]
MSPEKFKNKRIGVLMGGLSSEREVSLKSGQAVAAALSRLGYQQIPIDVDRDIALTLKREHIDVAFIALHGRYGEDGAIQGLLEIMGIPYTGSNITASAIAMDKRKSHDIFKAHGLPTPKTAVLTRKACEPVKTPESPFDFPVVVKPVSEGSSVGVSIVKKQEDLAAALDTAFQYGTQAMIQGYISGMEVHAGILDEKALGAIEVKSKGDFYDYTAKYVPGMSTHVYPAPLPPAVYQDVLNLALKAHQAVGCSGYSRVDFLVDAGMRPFILEVNTLPGMTETSLMPEMARENGITFDMMVEKILERAGMEYGESHAS